MTSLYLLSLEGDKVLNLVCLAFS